MTSEDIKHQLNNNLPTTIYRERVGLVVPQLRSCVKVEVDVLGSRRRVRIIQRRRRKRHTHDTTTYTRARARTHAHTTRIPGAKHVLYDDKPVTALTITTISSPCPTDVRSTASLQR